MTYMIHACPPRMWYVEKYLIPSMKAQGITDDEITIWNDENMEGNLPAFVASMEACAELPGGVWHLQDDVIICRRFAELTRENDEGLVCGFYCRNFANFSDTYGIVPAAFAWYSFPCIRIPSELARGFLKWFDVAKHQHAAQYTDKKHDDWFFTTYCTEQKDLRVLNLKPNLVDHIDYLIGGTLINQARLAQVNRAAFFEDTDLVDELERKLNDQ